MKTMISNLSLTNIAIHTEKDKAIEKSEKLQSIVNNWAHSHTKLNKILSDQIPEQCVKIIGGQINEAVTKFEQIKTEQNFPSSVELKTDFKTRFISSSFINQNLINKHCTTASDGTTTCTSRLTALDPSIRNHSEKYPTPTTETYLKFPISNGEVHSTKEILVHFPECSVSTSNSTKSDTELPKPVPKQTTTRTKSSVHQTSTRAKSPTHSNLYYTVKICYRCGDSSHKISDCTFDEHSRRVDNLKIRTDKRTRKTNSLNCLPTDCYSIFQ